MADTTWCADEQAAADALVTLRLKPGDVDEARIQHHAVVACGLIAEYLDRCEVTPDDPDDPDDVPTNPPITDPYHLAMLREAHGKLTAELYLRKDAPFGVFDAFDQDASSYRIGGDPLAGIRHLVTPMKARWGLA